MKKIFLLPGITLALIATFIILKHVQKPHPNAQYTIGILQTASHPALDAARDGFIEELQNSLGNKVNFIIQNAQGSISQAHNIAQQFHANKKLTGFFAIATPTAQAISSVEKERPIFIAAVTDPNGLGLLNPTTNVCGATDMIDVSGQIEMLTQLLPQAKTVGILYTTGETNSIVLVKMMHTKLAQKGLHAIDFAVSNESDMQAVVELACRKVDIILAPTDNTVASTISLISAIALKHKKPFIVSDNMLVKFGPLAARGVDYKENGKQTGKIAHEVITTSKKPFEIPIEQTICEKIYLNQTTLAALEISIPENLQPNIIFIS